MIETIETNNLPEELSCIYEAPRAWNRVVYRFSKQGHQGTHWEFDTEFRCTGILRILAFFMPDMFRKASLKDMTNFKNFAESR